MRYRLSKKWLVLISACGAICTHAGETEILKEFRALALRCQSAQPVGQEIQISYSDVNKEWHKSKQTVDFSFKAERGAAGEFTGEIKFIYGIAIEGGATREEAEKSEPVEPVFFSGERYTYEYRNHRWLPVAIHEDDGLGTSGIAAMFGPSKSLRYRNPKANYLWKDEELVCLNRIAD